jgi:hypothetical protein
MECHTSRQPHILLYHVLFAILTYIECAFDSLVLCIRKGQMLAGKGGMCMVGCGEQECEGWHSGAGVGEKEFVAF